MWVWNGTVWVNLGPIQGPTGQSGYSGYSGFSGISGYSGFSGISGYSGFSGISGYSGFSGVSGYSGFSGISGATGGSGISGYSGFSGYSGQVGTSGFSGYSGISGYSGTNGSAGVSGYSGFSGFSGISGFNGATGTSGYSGFSGYSGTTGLSGFSGFSGYSGVSGYSGLNGPSTTINATDSVTNTNYYLVAVPATGSNQTAYAFSTDGLTFNGSTKVLSSPYYYITGSIASAASKGALSYGTLAYTDTNIFASFTANINSYAQMILENTSTGTQASADFIVSSNAGTSSTYYGDFGINGSGFSQAGSFGLPNATYVYSSNGDLVLGSITSNAVRFVVNNSTTDAMTIDAGGGVSFNGSYGTSGYILKTNGSGFAPTWINGAGLSGYSGYSGFSGSAGATGSPGSTGVSGYSGFSGFSGTSGYSGTNGSNGATGTSGYSGYSGAFTTSSNAQVNSLGVGTAASGTTGEIRATNNVTAFYSDERLKTKTGDITNALDKLCAIETMLYHANETAVALGYDASIPEVGVTAQSVQKVQPEVVVPAPISDKYLTVRYERLIPLIIEAIKELRAEIKK